MIKAEIFFYSALFFLIGVALVSFGFNIHMMIAATFLMMAIFLLWGIAFDNNKKIIILGVLSSLILLGFYRYVHSDHDYAKNNLPKNSFVVLGGLMYDYPSRGLNSDKLRVRAGGKYSGNIQVVVEPNSPWNYGDLIVLRGVVKEPPPAASDFYKKENIHGIMLRPKIELVSHNQDSKIKYILFKFKESLIGSFHKILRRDEAALLSGILLGDTANFEKSFKDAMSLSGTSHLVALSGYNISILAWAVGASLGRFKRGRYSLILSIVFISGFILMTGAEASSVRAGIISAIILIAKKNEKVVSIRNALVFAALIMVVVNPRILVFDIGFELSFAAFLGIIFLEMPIRKLMHLGHEPGFLSWRDNLVTTSAAQIFVLPILLYNFGYFSLFSILANILILETIPLVMFFGFISGILSFFSSIISLPFTLVTSLFLRYEIFIIQIFSRISFPIRINFGFGGMFISYIFISFVAYLVHKKFNQANHEKS